jgi:RNA polymerase sigma-70 factor (ECF subfamily)
MIESINSASAAGAVPDQVLEDLLARARQGEVKAVNLLLDQYREQLKRYIDPVVDRRVRAKVDASDVAQDCLLEVFQHLGQFRGRTLAEFGAWVREIARNGALKTLRRWHRGCRNVQQEAALAEGSQPGVCLQDRGSSPSQGAARREEAEQVHQALARLRADDREVIRLRDLEGLEWVEVAQRMGRSLEAVKKLGQRALARLARELGGSDEHRRTGDAGYD